MFDFAAHGLIESPIQKPLPGGGPQTVADVLTRHVDAQPEQLALVGRSGRYTYAELDAAVRQWAAAFHALGLRRYDRIACCLPNDIHIVVALLACARIGAIWVGVNRPLAPPEKAFLLSDSGAQLYLTDAAGRDELAEQCSGLPELTHVLTMDRDANWLHGAHAEDCPEVAVQSFDPMAIAYTSGTTGRPKGAVHSHHNVLLPGAVAVCEQSFGSDCPQGVMLPLTILNLMVLAPLTAFQDGSACVCMDSLKPLDVARWVREESVGHFASVPTVIQDLLTHPQVDPQDLASLGRPDIGGAGIAQSFQTLYRERFGRSMTVAYGMTEAPTIVAKTSPDCEPEEELCGTAVCQLELCIVDEDDNVLPAGETGEVCVLPRSEGPYAGVYTTMLGYWNKPEATRQALSAGMYHSGDLGYLDGSGQLYIRGRKKELIIRGGANVYPAEVERVLVSPAEVLDVAVLGVDDERLGQRVVAVVETDCTDTASLERALRELCAAQIADYKQPAAFRFVEQLPRNAMNKVVKPDLVHLFSPGE